MQVQEGARIILGEAFPTPPRPARTIQYQKEADNTINLSIFAEAKSGQAITSAAMTQLRVPRSHFQAVFNARCTSSASLRIILFPDSTVWPACCVWRSVPAAAGVTVQMHCSCSTIRTARAQLNEYSEPPILKAKQLQSWINSGIRILSFSAKAIDSGSTCSSCSSQAIAGLQMNFI